ncbi:OsmC family protein [Domibacillus mangrovi]|uniref:Osmotically inducible protein C n=1 Tax=Domibacillus mangrovi TaxID=1714354 RepID=A0A1Q5P6L8_9BACI|nr:OsmC family protein [Domibacillus mangrovi]OKL37843.1 osmotically inducible protein C [Domibacillus mangrovi]
MTTKQLLKVTTSGEWENGVKTSISIRDFAPFIVDEPKSLGGTDEGPNPVELVLAGLTSCTSVTIAFVAKEQKFAYDAVQFENEGTLDLQGFAGVRGVKPHFETVHVDVFLKTEESEERIAELKREVERRCPVLSLLTTAGVEVTSNWVKK